MLRKSMDWFQFDNGLRHERANYYSMLQKHSIVQNLKEPMKAETAVDIVEVLKNSHGNFCSEVLGKNVAWQDFLNCSGLKFSLDFQNTQKQPLQKGVL